MTAPQRNGKCPAHSKRIYETRRDAKAATREIAGDLHLGVYRCDVAEGWHIGHLQRDVRRGLTDRASMGGTA
jgi:hypothetical protein